MDDLETMRAEAEARLDAAETVEAIYAARHTLALVEVAEEAEEHERGVAEHRDRIDARLRQAWDEMWHGSRADRLRAEADALDEEVQLGGANAELTRARAIADAAVRAVRDAFDAQGATALHCALTAGESAARGLDRAQRGVVRCPPPNTEPAASPPSCAPAPSSACCARPTGGA